MKIEVSRAVAAPAEVVWEILTDLANSPKVIKGIDAVEMLEGGEEFGVGTRWRETRTMFGKTAVEEMTVSAVQPGRSYTVVADSRGAHYESVLSVEPTGHSQESQSGCTLRMTFSGEPTGTVSKVLAGTVGRMFSGATRKAVEQDLADIAGAAEARAR